MSNTELEINTMIASRNVRADRNVLLSQCDWTQMPDAPLTAEQKQAWSEYRQALRDLTSSEGFPFAVQWPAKPQ